MPAGHSEKGPHKGANKIRLAFGQINLIETKYVDHQFSFFCSSDDSLKKMICFFSSNAGPSILAALHQRDPKDGGHFQARMSMTWMWWMMWVHLSEKPETFCDGSRDLRRKSVPLEVSCASGSKGGPAGLMIPNQAIEVFAEP